MLAEPHKYLAKIYSRYDLHQFIQDVTDQEVRIFSRVVVDLEYLPIAVDRTCARVAAKAEGGVATFLSPHFPRRPLVKMSGRSVMMPSTPKPRILRSFGSY